jgi:hypothetical protein
MIGLILSVGLITSCDKDDDDASDAVQLLSFGPTGAKHGDTLRFIGNSLNRVTEIVFTGTNANVLQKDFKEQTSEVIKVVVPSSAEQGFVTLKAPGGDIVSKTKLNLDALVSVASITAEARPGENITITGDLLNWVRSVTFERSKVVETFVSQTEKQLVVKIPDDAQTGPLVLAYAGTKPGTLQTEDTVKVTLPAAATLAPNPVKHQANLTITGTNLDLVREVIFSGVSTPVTTFVSQSATQLVVKVPASTTKGKITFKVASGVTVQSAAELTVQLPALTTLAPNPIDPEGNLTITGTNLDLVSSVSFAGVTNPVTTFVSQSPTQVVVKLPAGVIKGKVTLNVLNSTLKVASTDELVITGSTLAPFKSVVFDDVVGAAWDKWGGWGTDLQDVANTERPYAGANALKVVYKAGSWGAVQFHPKADFNLPNGHTGIRLSIYGGAGVVAGNKMVVYIKNRAGVESTGKELTLVPGAYTTYEILLSDLGDPANINELVIKNNNSTSITVYIDEVGLY